MSSVYQFGDELLIRIAKRPTALGPIAIYGPRGEEIACAWMGISYIGDGPPRWRRHRFVLYFLSPAGEETELFIQHDLQSIKNLAAKWARVLPMDWRPCRAIIEWGDDGFLRIDPIELERAWETGDAIVRARNERRSDSMPPPDGGQPKRTQR